MASPTPVRRPISINASAKFLSFSSSVGGLTASGGSGSGTAIGYGTLDEAQDEADEIKELAEELRPLSESKIRQEKLEARPAAITPPKKSKSTDHWRQLQHSLLKEYLEESTGTGGGYPGYGTSAANAGGTSGTGIGGYGTGGSGRGSEVASYIVMIAGKIQQNVNRDLCKTARPEVEFSIRLKPDGQLQGPPRIVRSSGLASCDDAIERAILQSLPLPVPNDAETFVVLHELNLLFRPLDENFGNIQ